MMNLRRHTFLLCLALTGWVACGDESDAPVAESSEGEATAETPTAAEVTPEDEPAPRVVTAAATRIALGLAADPRVDATHFEVVVVDGVATLTGDAASATEHAVAQAIAMGDAEVSEVVMSAAAPPLAEGETVPASITPPDPLEVYAEAIVAGTRANPDALLPEAEAEAEDGPSEEDIAAAASGDRPRTYRVQAGDSLSIIARRTMGDGDLWQELYDYNRNVIGPNPNGLQVGMELRVPQN